MMAAGDDLVLAGRLPPRRRADVRIGWAGSSGAVSGCTSMQGDLLRAGICPASPWSPNADEFAG